MRIHIVSDGGKGLEGLFGFVDDGLILQDGAIMLEVDGARKAGIAGRQALSLAMTFAERLQRGDGLYKEIGRHSTLWTMSKRYLPFPSPRDE